MVSSPLVWEGVGGSGTSSLAWNESALFLHFAQRQAKLNKVNLNQCRGIVDCA